MARKEDGVLEPHGRGHLNAYRATLPITTIHINHQYDMHEYITNKRNQNAITRPPSSNEQTCNALPNKIFKYSTPQREYRPTIIYNSSCSSYVPINTGEKTQERDKNKREKKRRKKREKMLEPIKFIAHIAKQRWLLRNELIIHEKRLEEKGIKRKRRRRRKSGKYKISREFASSTEFAHSAEFPHSRKSNLRPNSPTES